MSNRTTGAPENTHTGQMTMLRLALVALLLALTSCGSSEHTEDSNSPAPTTSQTPATSDTSPRSDEPTVLVSNLQVPWGLAFLPSGDALVSERDTGRILRVPRGGGEPSVVMRVPGVQAQGEGGLLGLAVSPTYARDRLVYAYFTSAQDNRIVRFRLGETPEVVLAGIPKARIHNGGRLAFSPEGNLFAGTGDAANPESAQDPESLAGKILRMTPNGEPVAGSSSLVFSLGHRNVQGLVFDDAGRLYATEFGANTFDEVNLVKAGDNGGWPLVEGVGDGSRFSQPIVTWTPEEASPSGAAIVGDTLYVAALRGQRLWRVPLDGRGGAGDPSVALDGFGRLRSVELAPDGSLWLMTSNTDGRGEPAPNDDRILRVRPS